MKCLIRLAEHFNLSNSLGQGMEEKLSHKHITGEVAARIHHTDTHAGDNGEEWKTQAPTKVLYGRSLLNMEESWTYT
ncbi:hypothetical protein Tco_1137285 [Tanacetum coccineum]